MGCIATQAHIMVVETHPQTILNIDRLEFDESSSRAMRLGVTFACAKRTSANRTCVRRNICGLQVRICRAFIRFFHPLRAQTCAACCQRRLIYMRCSCVWIPLLSSVRPEAPGGSSDQAYNATRNQALDSLIILQVNPLLLLNNWVNFEVSCESGKGWV